MHASAPLASAPFLNVPGEMGARMRAHDWSATPLGPVETWPQSLRTVVDLMLNARQPVYIGWGPALTSLYNDGFVPILGEKHPDALGTPFAELWAEIWDEYRPLVEATMAGEAQHFIDKPVALAGRPGRPVSWFTFSWTPVRDETGAIAGFFCAATETTEKVQDELSLHESKDQEVNRSRADLQLLTDALPVLVSYLEVDDDLRYRFVNKIYEEWFPHRREEILGQRVRDVVGEKAFAGVMPWLERALAGERVSFEQFMPYKEGSERHIKVEYVPRLGGDGEVEGIYALVQDITEAKRSEAALRESEARFRHMADSSPALIWMSDEEGRVIFANMHYEFMFGRPAAHMLDGGWAEIVLPEDLERHTKAFFDAFHTRSPFRCETRIIDRNGQVRWLRCDGVPRLDDNHRFLGYTGCNIDITEAKLAEQRRDLLINELNHRVKNTLATVQSIASQTLRTAGTAAEARDAIEARLMALSRAHDVLTRENWEGAWMREVVAHAISPFKGERESRFDVRGTNIRLEPRTALALAMAFQELATNAVKYGALSNDGGKVHLSWRLDRGASVPRLFLRWSESGGPPVVAPARRGFGSRLIERSLAQDLGGDVRIDFASTGVICTVDAPLASELAAAD